MDILHAEELRISDYVKQGDMLTWGQGSGEPLTLVEHYISARAELGQTSAFVGLSVSGTLSAEHTDFIKPTSYGALGSHAKLMKSGEMTIIPCHYSTLADQIISRRIPIDVVLVQISPVGPDGTHSLAMCNDFLQTAMREARVVIAEINENAPWTYMDQPLDKDLIDVAIKTDRALPVLKVSEPTEKEITIGNLIADLIPERATLQYGVGSLPSAILAALSGHREMGLHSGLITEDIIDLVEQGVITNTHKGIFDGKSVGALCVGGERLKNFLHRNPDFELHQMTSTHSARNLSSLKQFVALNSALEVDLFGQVNAEQIGTRYMGAIGGQVDFMHAAATSSEGLGIIALPACTGRGDSRIVAKLGGPFVTTARSDVDVVVTEYGIADLRGRSMLECAKQLCAIAAPQHRDDVWSAFVTEMELRS